MEFGIGVSRLKSDIRRLRGGFSTIGGSSVVLTAPNASNVDGLFHTIATFSKNVTGLTYTDFTVTNGTPVYLITESLSVYRLFVIPNAVGDVQVQLSQNIVNEGNQASNVLTVTINKAWQFLVTPSLTKFYYDYRELVGNNTDVITTRQQALNDLSGNNRNLSIVSSPQIRQQSAQPGINSLRIAASTGALNVQQTGATFLNSNFLASFRIRPEQGTLPVSNSTIICGNLDGSSVTGLTILINTAGKLSISYMTFTWLSDGVVIPTGSTTSTTFTAKFDFTNKVLTVKQDGVTITGTFTSGNITTVDPLTYNCSVNLYIGARNNNGSLQQNTPNTFALRYFMISSLPTVSPTEAELSTYLDAKPATLQLMSTLTSSTQLKAAHHVSVPKRNTSVITVTGKGDEILTTVPGSVANVNVSNISVPVIADAKFGTADLTDARTTIWLSDDRIITFADSLAILYSVSSTYALTKLTSLAYLGDGNGAIVMNGYIFAACMTSGLVSVFTVVNDVIALVGSCDVLSVGGLVNPLDVVALDSENIAVCNQGAGPQFAIFQAFSGGNLVMPSTWVVKSSINSTVSPNLQTANRIMTNDDGSKCMSHQNSGGHNIVSINSANRAAPSTVYDFTIGANHSSGKCQYRNKFDISASGEGLLILDFTQNPIIQAAGYFNRTDFTNDPRNTHEIEWFIINDQNYCAATFQADNKIGIYKINRI